MNETWKTKMTKSKFIWLKWKMVKLRGEFCILAYFKQQFSVFKQHYTYFHIFFHPHVFSKNTNNVTKSNITKRLIKRVFFFFLDWYYKSYYELVSWVQSNGHCEWWIYLTSNVYFVLINVIDFHVIGIDMQKT